MKLAGALLCCWWCLKYFFHLQSLPEPGSYDCSMAIPVCAMIYGTGMLGLQHLPVKFPLPPSPIVTSPVSPSLCCSVGSGVHHRTPHQCSLAQNQSDKMIAAVCSQTGIFHVPCPCKAYCCKELNLLLEGPEKWQSRGWGGSGSVWAGTGGDELERGKGDAASFAAFGSRETLPWLCCLPSPGLEGCSEPLNHCKGDRRAAWPKQEAKALSSSGKYLMALIHSAGGLELPPNSPSDYVIILNKTDVQQLWAQLQWAALSLFSIAGNLCPWFLICVCT